MGLWKKDNIAIGLSVLALLSFGLAGAQGWLKMQSEFFFFMIVVFGGIAFLLFTQKKNKVTLVSAWEMAKPALEKFEVTTEKGAVFDWGFPRKENGEFSEDGNIWDIQSHGNPKRASVFVSRRTGEILGLDANAPSREPPTGFEPKLFLQMPKSGKKHVKYDMKEEI